MLLALDDGDAACLDAAQVPIEVPSPGGAFETVLLDLHEVAILCESAQPQSKQLHNKAREFTIHYTQTGASRLSVQGDLTSLWTGWRLYLALHRQA